jgi:hypothetical protein
MKLQLHAQSLFDLEEREHHLHPAFLWNRSVLLVTEGQKQLRIGELK